MKNFLYEYQHRININDILNVVEDYTRIEANKNEVRLYYESSFEAFDDVIKIHALMKYNVSLKHSRNFVCVTIRRG